MLEPEPDMLPARGSTLLLPLLAGEPREMAQAHLSLGEARRLPGKNWAQLWQPAQSQVHMPGLSNLNQTSRASQSVGDGSLEATLSL